MRKINAVIFDWAGTTIDFGCFAPLNVFIDIFKNRGIDITLDEAREPMGMSKKDHIHTILKMERVKNLWKDKFGEDFTETDVENLYSEFEPSLMKTLHNYTDVLDGVISTCDYLRSKGIKIGSTTGYTSEMMEIVATEAKLKGYSPDSLVTPDFVSHGRPFPYMIFKNMELLDVYPPSSVVKVGDTISDIKEGVNAEVISVGVIIGSSVMGLTKDEFENLSDLEKEKVCSKVKQIFKEAGANYTILSMNDLPLLIEELNK